MKKKEGCYMMNISHQKKKDEKSAFLTDCW